VLSTYRYSCFCPAVAVTGAVVTVTAAAFCTVKVVTIERNLRITASPGLELAGSFTVNAAIVAEWLKYTSS